MIQFWFRVAGEDQFTTVSGGQMQVDHLEGGNLLQDRARCQPRRERPQPLFERYLQAVGDEGDEDMRLDAIITLVVDGAYRQIALELLEGLLDLGQLHVLLPRLRRICGGEVGTEQIVPVASPLPT